MTEPNDYYEVLGVGRSATPDELRKAYRAQARLHHPDLNPNDNGAAERFKSVSEAYEVLKDPQKRQMYDRFGHAGVRGAGGSAGHPDLGDISDLFESFFGFGGRGRGRGRRRAEQGGDLRVRLKLTFEEAVFGTTSQVSLDRLEPCEACGGSGAAPGTTATQCQTCQGQGEVRQVSQSVFGAFVNVQTCPQCGGRGERPATPCPECQGAMRRRRRRTLEVDIPAGVENATQIRLTGEGDHGLYGGPPGDLYVALEVAGHPVFERRGNDVWLQLWVNPADAALGALVTVPTLEGESQLTVPAGTQSGTTFRLENLGVPFLKRRGRGDQVVQVQVKTPDKLSREQRQLLEQLRATLPEARVARQEGGFWDKVREKLS